MKTVLLLDADYTVFSVAAACQVKIEWDDEVITQHIDLENAKDVLISSITSAAEVADDPDAEIILCFSCPTRRYFRHDLYPGYKSNRRGAAPPLGLSALREWAVEQWDSRTKPGLEADDVLGIFGTDQRLLREFGRRIVVSVDKDLLQIPGLHINPNDTFSGVFNVTEAEATERFWLQTLTGDSTDGYPGCPGLGPVKAAAVLAKADPTNPWPSIVAAYQKAGQTADDALCQARLARILRAEDYDHKNKAPILWQPSVSSTSKVTA